jgi:hypothetical protein
VLRCLGLSPTPCEPNTGRCEGSRAINCVNYPIGAVESVRDCAQDINGNTACVASDDRADCTSPDPCGPNVDRVACEGDTVRFCTDTHARQIDCTLSGEVCRPDSGGCAFDVTDEPCVRCDGNTSQACSGGSTTTDRLDCTPLDLMCNPEEGARCVAPMQECEPFDARCDGDVIQLCYGGRWWRWDCGAYGARCDGPSAFELRCVIDPE